MKKFLIATASIFIMQFANANHKNSEFNIKMFDNSSLEVFLDGAGFSQNCGPVSISNVQPGQHYLKVFKWIKKGHHHHHGWQKVPVYSGWIKIPPRSSVFSVINCYGDYNVVNIKPINYYGCGHPYGQCSCNNGFNPVGGYHDWDDEDCYDGYCMGDDEFGGFYKMMQQQSFDSGKLELIKQASSKNKFNSDQVLMLVQTFTFESSKLDAAKMLYTKTTDKKNYYKINQAFTFNSNVEELGKFIAGK